MVSRVHISTFILIIIFLLVSSLWIQGVSVLSTDFFKHFGIIVFIITTIITIFNKHIWSWKIFKGWYVNRPDLRGTWEVEIKSNWIDPKTGPLIPICGYAVIRQTLMSLSVRLMTKESRSVLVAHSIIKQEDDDLFKLVGVYRNEPKIELQGVRSEIHHGSFVLEVHGAPVYELEGHYWTDRATKGGIKLRNKVKKLYDTYEQAEREIRAK